MKNNALAMMMSPTGLPGVDPTRQQPMPGMSTSTAVAPAPMQKPQPNALANPMTANFNPPKPKQQNMLLSSAVNGFQRGLDPKGWQAGQDQAKADKAEGVKKQIAMLQNIRALPMEQRMQALPQISQSIGKQIPPELMQDQAIDTHLAMLMGEAGMAPSTPEPMSEYQRAQIGIEREKLNKPKPPIEVNGVLVDPETYEPVYTSPKDPKYFNTGQAVVSVGPDGKSRVLYRDPDRPNSGGQPPSGYRWKQDGSLERIPGGPADKPTAPAYDAPTARKYLTQAQTLDSLDGAINQYMGLIEKHGPQIMTSGVGGDNKVAAQLDAARTAIDIQTKELFNLGVLNGPDLDIIRGAIPDVTGFEAFGKTGDSVSASMNVLRDYIARSRNQIPPEIVSRARPNGGDPAPQQTTGAGGPKFPDGTPITRENLQKLPPQLQEVWSKLLPPEANNDPNDDAFIDSLFPADSGSQPDGGGLPAGVTQEEWDAMTPEEQALFQ